MKKTVCIASLLFFASFVMTGWAAQPDTKIVRAPQRVTVAGKKVTGVTRLFILSGQSNMAGLDETQTLIPTVEKAFPDDELIFVKDSASGQPIRLWYKDWKPVGDWTPRDARSNPGNNNLYRRLMDSVKLAIEGKNIQSVTFIWMQGEADAKPTDWHRPLC